MGKRGSEAPRSGQRGPVRQSLGWREGQDLNRTGQTCRARYQGPELPELMLAPPRPAWESSYHLCPPRHPLGPGRSRAAQLPLFQHWHLCGHGS